MHIRMVRQQGCCRTYEMEGYTDDDGSVSIVVVEKES